MPSQIHGYPVIGWFQTTIVDGKPAGIVLVQRPHQHEPYVVAWYREGDEEWANGYYAATIWEAEEEFASRTNLNRKPGSKRRVQ